MTSEDDKKVQKPLTGDDDKFPRRERLIAEEGVGAEKASASDRGMGMPHEDPEEKIHSEDDKSPSNWVHLEGRNTDAKADPVRDGSSMAEGSDTPDGFEPQIASETRAERTANNPPRHGGASSGYGFDSSKRKHFSLNDLLLSAAGADPEWFHKNRNANEEQRKLRNQGLIICITTSFAALSSYYFFASFFGDGTFVGAITGPVFSVLLTIVWAATIFTVDRAMLMTMLGSEGRRIVPAIGRLFLAAAIGVIIAHPLKVQIFQPEIRSVYERMRAEYFVDLDETLRVERNSQMIEIISQFPSEEIFDRAFEIEQSILRRRNELQILDAARLFELSGSNSIYQSDESLPDLTGRTVKFVLPLLSSPIEVSVSTIPLDADPRDPSDVENKCRTTRASEASLQILRQIQSQYASLVNQNNGQDHRLVVSDPEKIQVEGASSALTALVLNSRRYVPGGSSALSGGLLNCDLFAWASAALSAVINDLESELESLGIVERDLQEFRTGLQSIQRLNEVALASQICIVPMRNYTVADNERDRRSVGELRDGELTSIRDRIFDPLRDPNMPLPRDESKWVAYICAQSYPDFSFMWQTAILFGLTSPDEDGMALAAQANDPTEQDSVSGAGSLAEDEVILRSQTMLAAGIFPPGTAAIASISITLLFILIEVLPLLSKLFSRPGAYELSVAHKNRQAALNFAEHKESPQEEVERRQREAEAKYAERHTIQTAEATLAFRALVLQKKAETAVSDLPEEVIREKLRGLDQSLEEFIRETEPRLNM